MQDESFGLPRDLGNGLLLRWATPADADELAAFNVRIHSDNSDKPDEFLAYWTRDLMNGNHPTTQAHDFTVVVDTHRDNKIVSSLNLISQQWAYAGIPFRVGRPELVGTDSDYRRKGLVRAQMDMIHAKSAARGEMVQAITGIPWYYRMFGYEMALNLGGGRHFFWNRSGNNKPVAAETYQLRPAVPEDLPQLLQLYPAHCADSLIVRVRDETVWAYELFTAHRESPYAHHVYLVTTAADEVVGYVDYNRWGQAFLVHEVGVQPGHPWRPVVLFLTRALRAEADALSVELPQPIERIFFDLGEKHPVYEALGRQLEHLQPSYAWYLRVPDLPGFIRHITPVLEERLAQSIMSGHSGTIKLNFYKEQMTLVWLNGKLQEVGTYQPERLESGDAVFPDLTFLQLLFGYRSVAELDHAFADCYMNEETRILLHILFPKRPSAVIGLG